MNPLGRTIARHIRRLALSVIFALLAITAFVSVARSAVAVWSIGGDYSCQTNPNGAWSYGRTWAAGAGGGFDLMNYTWYNSSPSCTCTGNNCGRYMGNWGHGGPSMSPAPLRLWAKNNTNGYPDVRWTCSDAGTYHVAGRFRGDDSRGVDNYVYVVVDDVVRSSGRVRANMDSVTFSLDVSLAAGSHVDFVVVWAGGVYSEYGWTGIEGTIEPTFATPAARHTWGTLKTFYR